MVVSSDITAQSNLDALKWRCIGPPRGGRVVAVAGDPDNQAVFYFGACAGGVWKTVDGGIYWRCVTDGFLGTAAIGALAVARADGNVIYAGTGETAIRLDVSYGDGIYKSTDAGRSWSHAGLRETKHIGRICIHPHDPDLVYVAALGDIFGPSEERGVFRSRDGGRTWDKVLYRNADTGAVDLSMDAGNPRILFATLWQTRRNFWNHVQRRPRQRAVPFHRWRRQLGGDLAQSRPADGAARQDRGGRIAGPLRPRLGAGGDRGRENRPLSVGRLRGALGALSARIGT